VVRSWRWSVSASSAIGSTVATGRRSYSGLELRKGIDSSSTGLMSALATNDEVKEAKLTMRRAGGEQEPYLVITLGGARVSSLEHEVSASGDAIEVVTILFTKVEVEYRGQKRSGGRGGSTTFNDEIFNEE
ncbi:MAG: type VI secretion system tube protein Hcp, partial [Burkholderiales bacterium]|nr:type VI secretion system tube protein Hcp [Burkholderiales bacterium]